MRTKAAVASVPAREVRALAPPCGGRDGRREGRRECGREEGGGVGMGVGT